jgi:alkylation response protein AidB-like acyl-CoA dehydrogenase
MNAPTSLAQKGTLPARAPSMTHLFDDNYGPYTAAVRDLAEALATTATVRDKAGGTAYAERRLIRDSGLLQLSVPKAHGGPEVSWPLIFRIVRRLASADSSLGHVYGFQHLQIATVLLFANPAQQRHLMELSVLQNWFWGNATNVLDAQVRLTAEGDHFRLHGLKTFCSGASDSDVLNVSVPRDDGSRIILTVPTRRDGVIVVGDWDAMGQRQTDSGSLRFDQVRVEPEEILGPPGANGSPRATLRPLVSHLVLAEVFNGNARGALEAAWHYVHEQARPWMTSTVARAADDGYIMLRFGELWTRWQAAVALTESATRTFQSAWDRGHALTADERGNVAMQVAQARWMAARTGLDITTQIFETMGARAVAAKYGFDRFWRNVRTHSLHDPLDYKLQEIGHWVLDAEPPVPSIYS